MFSETVAQCEDLWGIGARYDTNRANVRCFTFSLSRFLLAVLSDVYVPFYSVRCVAIV